MDIIKNYAGFLWASKLGRNQNETYEILVSVFGSIENAFTFEDYENLPEKILENKIIAKRIKDTSLKEEAIKDISLALEMNMKICSIEDEEYPENLFNYVARPIMFFYYGDLLRLKNVKHKLAVVGSRNCSQYGKDITKRFVESLKGKEVAIISGLARGIDSVSHRTAVENDMVTVAVLGCGLNIVYPAENVGLFKKIKETGVIISEYVPNTAPFKSYFPARNRIIAGLSDAVLVVEAGLGSGALITADLAINDGKDVLAVPNRIDVSCGSGCNSLIKNGAYCVTSETDIYYALGIEDEAEKAPEMLLDALNENELGVYKVIKINPEIYSDEIVEELGLSEVMVKRCLSSLEINGFIRRTSSGGFVC